MRESYSHDCVVGGVTRARKHTLDRARCRRDLVPGLPIPHGNGVVDVDADGYEFTTVAAEAHGANTLVVEPPDD